MPSARNRSAKVSWPSWMERLVRESDFVLVICMEFYLYRAEKREEADAGHGVIFESTLSPTAL
jgi:hypothetical protein